MVGGSRVRRRSQRVVALIALVVGLVMLPKPATAGLDYTQCPAITDSITRLYSAYFARPPDAGGFTFWATEWGTGSRSLAQISDGFVGAPEFTETYGGLSNAQFVDLVYQNVLGRSPDSGGRAYWIGQLDRGLSRGVMMLQFSESSEFVTKTGTRAFFGGFFQTFPTGTVFYCGSGEATIPIAPIKDQRYVHSTGKLNPGEAITGNFIIWLHDADGETVNLLANELLADPAYNGVDWEQEESVEKIIDHRFRKTSVELRVTKAPDNLQWGTIIYPAHIQSSPFG